MKKIGVVVAMQSELDPILAGITYSKTEEFGKTLYRAEIGNNEVWFIVSGVGEICSAAATQVMICAHKPDLILNVGVAGGLADDLKQCDIVVATGVVHYNFDCSALDGVLPGQYTGYDTPVIPCDKKYVDEILACDPTLKTGIIASGDKFIADTNFKNHLVNTFGVSVGEMESAGVVITAKNNGVDVLIAKMISDHADENASADFDAMFDKNAHLILKFVEFMK